MKHLLQSVKIYFGILLPLCIVSFQNKKIWTRLLSPKVESKSYVTSFRLKVYDLRTWQNFRKISKIERRHPFYKQKIHNNAKKLKKISRWTFHGKTYFTWFWSTSSYPILETSPVAQENTRQILKVLLQKSIYMLDIWVVHCFGFFFFISLKYPNIWYLTLHEFFFAKCNVLLGSPNTISKMRSKSIYILISCHLFFRT